MPRLFDADRSEIDRRDVEGRLSAAINGRRHQADDVLRAEPMNDVGEQRERRAAAERTHQGQWEKIGRELERRQNRREQTRQQIDSTGAFEHADATETRDKDWN